jgi:hypothetical protein
MKTSLVRSSRRLPALGVLAALALCALLALVPFASAAGKGSKCADGAEASGCKLPVGARFYKTLPHNASITVQVNAKGVSVSAYAAAIKCTRFAPYNGNESYVAVGISGTQRPKVGKSYSLKESETQRGEEGEGTSTTVTEVTLTFKSAQLVVVKMHQVSETDGQVGCDGGATWNVKRQSS